MPATDGHESVASLDSARRALVLLGALLYPLSDERAALEGGDAEAYCDAVAARMRGVCAQSQAILENGLKSLGHGAGDTKARRGRRRARAAVEMPDGVSEHVDRILAECDVPDARLWLKQGKFPTGGAGTPLEDLVPVAARVAAAAVRLAVLAAGRIDPPPATAPGGIDGDEQAAVVAGGTLRTARRIAHVLDEWDMLAGTPTAIIGCPPPPGSVVEDPPPAEQTEPARRSLGVAAALATGDESAGAAAEPSRPALRRSRTDKVWSAGGAVQRD